MKVGFAYFVGGVQALLSSKNSNALNFITVATDSDSFGDVDHGFPRTITAYARDIHLGTKKIRNVDGSAVACLAVRVNYAASGAVVEPLKAYYYETYTADGKVLGAGHCLVINKNDESLSIAVTNGKSVQEMHIHTKSVPIKFWLPGERKDEVFIP